MSEPVTIIGANTVVNGNLEGDEDLTIEGRVEGTINLSRTLTIESNGVVHANINVRNAVISGVLVGNVEAEDSVHITDEGRVMGDISAPRVILVDGASFRGSIDMGDFDIERSESLSAVSDKPVRVAAPIPKPRVIEERPPVERIPVRPRRTPSVTPPPAKKPVTPAPPVAPAAPTQEKPRARRAPAPKVRAVGKTKAAKKKRG